MESTKLLSREAARVYLGNMSLSSFYRLYRDRKLPYVKLGRKVLFDQKDLNRFIAKLKQTAGNTISGE